MTSLDDLRERLTVAEDNARTFLEQRCDADRERYIAHLKYVAACKEGDVLRAQINRPSTRGGNMSANPIIQHYRERADRWPLSGYIDSLSEDNRWQWGSLATTSEMDSALRIFTRLEVFRAEES